MEEVDENKECSKCHIVAIININGSIHQLIRNAIRDISNNFKIFLMQSNTSHEFLVFNINHNDKADFPDTLEVYLHIKYELIKFLTSKKLYDKVFYTENQNIEEEYKINNSERDIHIRNSPPKSEYFTISEVNKNFFKLQQIV